jgi:hypothetical protein
MRKIHCDDVNGRKFSLMVDDDAVVIDQAWIDRQNANRAKVGRAPIAKWSVKAV